MTNERKAELFDKAMDWIFRHLAYGDRTEIEEALEDVGYTDEEIAEVFAEIEEE